MRLDRGTTGGSLTNGLVVNSYPRDWLVNKYYYTSIYVIEDILNVIITLANDEIDESRLSAGKTRRLRLEKRYNIYIVLHTCLVLQ